MFQWITWILGKVIYEPQLNLLYFLHSITGDIGVSIVILAIFVNLLLWPIIVKSYINGQKMRVMAPKIREIQSRYKTSKEDEPAVAMQKVKAMQAEIKTFYKKHDIQTGIFFQVVFFQIFFASGVYYVVNNVSRSVQSGVPIEGIYSWLYGVNSVLFPRESLGFLVIDASSTQYIWLPISSLILSYLYGKYSFHWAPNTQLIDTYTKPTSEETKSDDTSALPDPQAIQKSQEFMIIYLLPLFTFGINASFSAGLNLYFATLSLFNLIRHIIITQYYASHVSQLMNEIANSDPEVIDKNDLEEDLPPQDDIQIALDQPVAELIENSSDASQ